MSHKIAPEDRLRGLQSLLKNLEAKQAIQNARWEYTMAFTPDEKKPGIANQIEKQKARNNHEMNALKQKIRAVEEQIVREDEETRAREAARAWLKSMKANARESWLGKGGSESSFEASWPEMERQLLMQHTMGTLSVQPQPDTMPAESASKQSGTKSTKRTWHSWDPIRPPSDPKKKKRTG